MVARVRARGIAAAVMVVVFAGSASAQVFGTFSWQMQPYCNVVTLTITQFPAGYTVDGNDNQCGAATTASATGQVHINPDGTVGVDFAIITTPSGKAVHVAAALSPANGSGTWLDSVGNSGTFALGANTPGLPVRPFPASGLGASIITTTEIAAGAVGGSDINTAEVQARVTGTCAAGQAITAVAANGAVTCAGANDVRFRMRSLTGTLAVASSTIVNVNTWATTDYNAGGGTYSAATGAYTVPVAGTYLITASVRWQQFGNTGAFRCVWLDTSSAGRLVSNCDTPSLATFPIVPVSTVAQLAAGTTIRVQAYQETGVAAFVGPNTNDSHFAVTLLR